MSQKLRPLVGCLLGIVSSALLLTEPAQAQIRAGTCSENGIVIADHSGYTGATFNAITALSPGRKVAAATYERGSDVGIFINSIRAMRPRILVIHYSIFELNAKARPRGLRQLVEALEAGKNPIRPYYIVYSGAFRSVLQADTWIRRPSLPFEGVPSGRIATISLSGLKRFVRGNGEGDLIKHIRTFETRGACSRLR